MNNFFCLNLAKLDVFFKTPLPHKPENPKTLKPQYPMTPKPQNLITPKPQNPKTPKPDDPLNALYKSKMVS